MRRQQEALPETPETPESVTEPKPEPQPAPEAPPAVDAVKLVLDRYDGYLNRFYCKYAQTLKNIPSHQIMRKAMIAARKAMLEG